MQISAANLLASQSQTVRSSGPAAAFEPIAFKQTPPSAVTQGGAPTAAGTSSAGASGTTAPRAAASYVRPGSQIDIKI
jgi:hypothetical protein